MQLVLTTGASANCLPLVTPEKREASASASASASQTAAGAASPVEAGTKKIAAISEDEGESDGSIRDDGDGCGEEEDDDASQSCSCVSSCAESSTCSETSAYYDSEEDEQDEAEIEIALVDANNNDRDDWDKSLQDLHALLDQRETLFRDCSTAQSKTEEAIDRYSDVVDRETELIDLLREKVDLHGRGKRRRNNMICRELKISVRELRKKSRALKRNCLEKRKIAADILEEARATLGQISMHLKSMASNREEYSKLLERAYKSKRCAHCLEISSEEKDGVETTKRCGGCKAVHYCDEECQAANWDVHQHFCHNLKERRDERIAKWYEKDRRHRDFEEKLNCGWYGEESDAVGLAGSAGPFINELLGFGGPLHAGARDSTYDGCNAKEGDEDTCCMNGCVVS